MVNLSANARVIGMTKFIELFQRLARGRRRRGICFGARIGCKMSQANFYFFLFRQLNTAAKIKTLDSKAILAGLANTHAKRGTRVNWQRLISGKNRH